MLRKLSFLILLLEFGYISTQLNQLSGIMENFGRKLDLSVSQDSGDVTRRVYTRGELYAIRRNIGPPNEIQLSVLGDLRILRYRGKRGGQFRRVCTRIPDLVSIPLNSEPNDKRECISMTIPVVPLAIDEQRADERPVRIQAHW